MCKEKISRILNIIRKRMEKREGKIIKIKEILKDKSFLERISILGYLIYFFSKIEFIENEKAKISLVETIYHILKNLFTPIQMANAIGTLGILLINEYPEMIPILNQGEKIVKEASKERIGLV